MSGRRVHVVSGRGPTLVEALYRLADGLEEIQQKNPRVLVRPVAGRWRQYADVQVSTDGDAFVVEATVEEHER